MATGIYRQSLRRELDAGNAIPLKQAHRAGDEMAVEAVPPEGFERAKRWGDTFFAWIMQTLERLTPVAE